MRSSNSNFRVDLTTDKAILSGVGVNVEVVASVDQVLHLISGSREVLHDGAVWVGEWEGDAAGNKGGTSVDVSRNGIRNSVEHLSEEGITIKGNESNTPFIGGLVVIEAIQLSSIVHDGLDLAADFATSVNTAVDVVIEQTLIEPCDLVVGEDGGEGDWVGLRNGGVGGEGDQHSSIHARSSGTVDVG